MAQNDMRLTTTDLLAAQYSAVAEDGSKSPAAREAAMHFSLAEQHLEESDDYEACLKTVDEALKGFRSVGDFKGVADAVRLKIHAYRSKADNLQHSSLTGRRSANEVLDEAERLATSEMATFKEKGDKRGEAAMKLCIAEINIDGRNSRKTLEASEAARDAQNLRISDPALEAAISIMMVNVLLKEQARQDAKVAAEKALALYSSCNSRRGMAKAFHMVAYTKMLLDEFEDGLEAAEEARMLFRELGDKKLEAFENFVTAQYLVVKGKIVQALPIASDALNMFRAVKFGCWTAHAYDQVVECHIAAGQRKEALRIAHSAVSEFTEAKDKRCEALALRTLSYAHAANDDLKEALSAAEESLMSCQGLQDQKWEARMHNEIAKIHIDQGDLKEATESLQEGILVMQSIQDKEGEAELLNTLTQVKLAQNDTDAAQQSVAEQRALFQQTGDKSKEASTLMNLAGCLSLEGKLDQAFDLVREAKEIGEDVGDKKVLARAWNMDCELLAATGRLEDALQAAEEMRRCMKDTGDQAKEAEAVGVLLNLHLQRDNPYEAVKLANEGLMLAKKSGDRRVQVTMWTLVATAQIALLTQDGQANLGKQATKALRPAQEALSMAKKLNDRELIGSALHTLANVQLRSGKAVEAMANLNEARSIFYKSGNKSWEISVVLLMAEAQIAKGMDDKAKELANTALDMARSCGDPDREKEANALIEKLTPKPTMPPPGQWVMQAPIAVAQDPSGAAPAATPSPAESAAVVEAPGQKRLTPEIVQANVIEVAKQITGGDETELHGDIALMDAGLDSLSALSFRQTLSQMMDVKLPSSFVFDYPTINEVTGRIIEISNGDA